MFIVRGMIPPSQQANDSNNTSHPQQVLRRPNSMGQMLGWHAEVNTDIQRRTSQSQQRTMTAESSIPLSRQNTANSMHQGIQQGIQQGSSQSVKISKGAQAYRASSPLTDNQGTAGGIEGIEGIEGATTSRPPTAADLFYHDNAQYPSDEEERQKDNGTGDAEDAGGPVRRRVGNNGNKDGSERDSIISVRSVVVDGEEERAAWDTFFDAAFSEEDAKSQQGSKKKERWTWGRRRST